MTRGTITLTHEEQRRVKVLTEVREGRLLAQEAARLLSLSVRHCRRLLAAFRRDGPAALAHGGDEPQRPEADRTAYGSSPQVATHATTGASADTRRPGVPRTAGS